MIYMKPELILGSAVVAAVCSGIFSYLISRRQGNLQYVTRERKEWREEIRKIAMDIEGASYQKTLRTFIKLKVRINAFGDRNYFKYDEDGHIWEVIRQLEEKNPGKKELERQQRLLIDYLSLLLKADWERSKKEVRGNVYEAVSWFFEILAGGSFMMIIVKEGKEIKLLYMVMIAIFYTVYIFILKRILMYEIRVFIKSILGVTKSTKSYRARKSVGATIVLMGGMGILAAIYLYISGQLLSAMNVGEMYKLGLIYLGSIQLAELGFECVQILEEIDMIYRLNERVFNLRKRWGRC